MEIKKDLKKLSNELNKETLLHTKASSFPVINELRKSLSNLLTNIDKLDKDKIYFKEYIYDISEILKLILKSETNNARKILSEILINSRLDQKKSKLLNNFTDTLKYDNIYREIENVIFGLNLIIDKLEKEGI